MNSHPLGTIHGHNRPKAQAAIKKKFVTRSLQGQWEMTRHQRFCDEYFRYTWVHSEGDTEFSGYQTAEFAVRGQLTGNRITWQCKALNGDLSKTVTCRGTVNAERTRITDGEYFGADGNKKGSFTGRRCDEDAESKDNLAVRTHAYTHMYTCTCTYTRYQT